MHGTERLKKLPLSGELASECETERVRIIKEQTMAEQLWKGRFSKAVDSRVNDFNSSIRFD